MRIYTRTGDEGETGLFGGPRVVKSHLRVEAYGTVDELNAGLGWAASQLDELPLADDVHELQADLLVVGADLATPPDATEAARARVTLVGEDRVLRLEARIDALGEETPPLDKFILPGGHPAAAAFQLCRTICRRAERRVVSLAAESDVNPIALTYLNRLSDLLFVMARWVNARVGRPEPVWEGAEPDPAEE